MSESNPYESPQAPQPLAGARPFSWRKVIVGAVLLILLVPASGFAFMVSCIVAYNATENETTALGGGAVCALVTFALIVVAFVQVAKTTPRPRDLGRPARLEEGDERDQSV